MIEALSRLAPMEAVAWREIAGVSLSGSQGEPPGMMTVTAHLSDGSEVVLIQDNGNVISHWKNTADTIAGPRHPAVSALVKVCRRMADDYQTSAGHHPHHVLVRKADFDAAIQALAVIPTEGLGSSLRDTHRAEDRAVVAEKESGQ